MQTQVRIIGIAGGSGSGKTTFARELAARLPKEHCEIIFQDNYYIDQSARFDFDGGNVNFDHPDALDFDLLAKQLAALKSGFPIEIPIYDFATHRRVAQTLPLVPKAIILVDGILIFHPEKVRNHFDDLIYFDTPEPLRFQRRLERDVRERGRIAEGVKAQFERQVKPMHDQFVEPTRCYANTVVSELEEFSPALETYISHCLELIASNR
ncbi:MAG: uridine kinase [Cryobacterium sp.]|nr:uridine kinase [Oligoflexia bacterium]